MRTLIKPAKVEFNESGYQDLVNKIIALEQDREKLYNVISSLISSFDVSKETINVLQSRVCDVLIFKDDSKDQKSLLQVKPKQL